MAGAGPRDAPLRHAVIRHVAGLLLAAAWTYALLAVTQFDRSAEMRSPFAVNLAAYAEAYAVLMYPAAWRPGLLARSRRLEATNRRLAAGGIEWLIAAVDISLPIGLIAVVAATLFT